MQILFYSKNVLERPGVVIHVHIVEVLNGLSNLGHTVYFVDGKKYLNIEHSKKDNQVVLEEDRSFFRYSRMLFKKMHIYDEVLLLTAWVTEVKLFFTALKTARKIKPDIIYRRHVQFKSEYYLSRLIKVPCIVEVNGLVVDEAEMSKYKDRVSLFLMDRLERTGLKKADKHIVVTSKLKEILIQDYKIPENKIEVIENGANTSLFKPMDVVSVRQLLKMDPKSNYICFVGSLVYWQGIEYAVKMLPCVLKTFPHTYLLIIGDGEMRQSLFDQSKNLGISDHVIFTGDIPYEQVPVYINTSDICIVPKKPLKSGYSPLKLCEYMACGKPVVATRTDGFEFLEENAAGILMDPGDKENFASVIIKLLGNPDLRVKMGENGRRYVVKYRSWESISQTTARVCERTIQDFRVMRHH